MAPHNFQRIEGGTSFSCVNGTLIVPDEYDMGPVQLVDFYTGLVMQIPMSGDSMVAGYGNTLVIAPSGGPPHVLRYRPGDDGEE